MNSDVSPGEAGRLLERWRQLVSEFVALQPKTSNPRGLLAAADRLQELLIALGFDLTIHQQGESAPILIARRPGTGACLGMAGHYDVEEAGQGWSSEPFSVVERSGRLYGRGLADNLGPLLLRVAVLEAREAPTPPLLWIIQGEEEIGSPAAHQLYPALPVSDVSLWLEETGYFEADRTQRLLVMNIDQAAQPLIAAITQTAEHEGRTVDLHARYLNKAFGQHRCPFLVHLAAGRPYLAFGPNDPDSRIHDIDESLPLATLPVSVRQLNALLNAGQPLNESLTVRG